MRSLPVEMIVESIRDAEVAGYSERLDLLRNASQKVRTLCSKMERRDALGARPAFHAVLEIFLSGKCAPQCCDASYVRAQQIAAKCEVLTTWRRLDPDVAETLRPTLIAQLIVPTSKRIALAAVELLERSPVACETHIGVLIGALEHPRWQVAECVARILGKIAPVAKDQSLDALTKTLRHSQWQVRKAAVKALGRMLTSNHKGLAHLAKRDPHPAVRYAACKALGLALPRPAGA